MKILVTIQKDSLFEEDFRGSFAVETEGTIWKLHHGAHGLTNRIKGVDLVELLFWDLFTDGCIVSLQVQHKAQQATLSLIPNLLRQATFHIRGLEVRRGEKSLCINTGVFNNLVLLCSIIFVIWALFCVCILITAPCWLLFHYDSTCYVLFKWACTLATFAHFIAVLRVTIHYTQQT